MRSPLTNFFLGNNRKEYWCLVIGGFLILLFLSSKADAQSVNATKGGKGLQFISADSTFTLKLNARIQALYAGVKNRADNEYVDEMQIRRSRLKMEGYAFGPKWEYKLELGLSNSDIGGNIQRQTNNTANIILDALVRYNVSDNVSLWFGQTKLPGNRERVISSQKLQFVDRSLLNARYNIDRDIGVQLHHQYQSGQVIFREIASISMGEGRNITVENKGGYDYTARIEVLPFGDFKGEGDYVGSDLSREETPKLAIGITYDYNDGASRERGQLGNFLRQQRDLKTLFADAMFKYQGFSAMLEYANKKSSESPVVMPEDTNDVTSAFFTGTGFNLQAGYLFKNNYEIAGRYTSINPENITQRDNNKQYTLGLSRYLLGHTVKVQSDLSLLQEQTAYPELMYRFQVEIGF